jgi:competence protein ComEA
MRRDDDSSTAQRVRQLLDRSLTGATDSDSPNGSTTGPDEVWPSEWPPGWPADQAGEPSDVGPGVGPGRGSGVSARTGPRWQVPGLAAVAAGAMALLIVAVVIVLLLRGPASGTPVPAGDPVPFANSSAGLLGAATPTATASGDPGALSGTALPSGGTVQPVAGQYRVYVVGQVRRPGVVSLAPGARVEDAVNAAGGVGPKADLTVMNLARKVIDGERIVVPRPGEKIPTEDPVPVGAGGATGAEGQGSAAPGAPVDLNTATVADLDALPGVGPVIAGRIVAWRQQNGRFNRVDDLAEVQGIGAATLEKLRPLVRV